MQSPFFGWVDVLSALSRGAILRRAASGWLFDGSVVSVDPAVIDDLLGKAFIECLADKAQITEFGTAALTKELDATFDRTSQWLRAFREGRRDRRN